MRKLTMAAIAGLALAGAGTFAGLTLAGPGAGGESREVAEAAVAHPVTGVPGRDAQARGGGRRGPTIDFFYAREDIVPADGGGLVQPLRCPRGAGQPIAGGARTGNGIVIAYLSRAHPTTGNTPARTYFIGVEDIDTGAPDPNPGAGALVEIQCAKGMKVRD
jgi:hypothetical protein